MNPSSCAPSFCAPSFCAPSLGLFLPACLLLTVAAPAGAAQTEFVVSTSSDAATISPALPFLEDGDLLFVGQAPPVRPFLTSNHWRGLGSLLPTDVDAIGFRKDQTLLGPALLFSLLSDQAGFRDGDVLGLMPGGGTEVLWSEAELQAALGTTTGIDLDGLDLDSEGLLVFSLQNDLANSSIGPISNGDVLRLEANGVIRRLWAESEVQSSFEFASGSSSSIGDVHGIALLAADEIAVCVQSPSAYDGGILRVGTAPTFLLEEGQLGLLGEELDGIAVAPQDQRALTMWVETTGTPGVGRAVVEGDPGDLVAAIPAGGAGYMDTAFYPGFGAFYFDPMDPALLGQLFGPGLVIVQLDGAGRFESPIALPSAGAGLGFDGSNGWTFQLISLTTAELSAPVRVEI